MNHFTDARGANNYEKKEAIARSAPAEPIVSLGIPCKNLAELEAEHHVLTGKGSSIENPTEEFQRYVDCAPRTSKADRSVTEEILQEIGRLRSHRRPKEKLVYYLCADIDVQWLRDLGYNVEEEYAFDICPEAGTKRERIQAKFESIYTQLRKRKKR